MRGLGVLVTVAAKTGAEALCAEACERASKRRKFMPKTACMVGGGLCCRGAPVRAKAPGGCALGPHADRLLSRR